MHKQPKWSRRNILTVSATSLLYSGSKAVAAEGPDKIRIAQIGTSHAHAAGKMAAVRKLSDIYDVAGIAEPIESQHAHARKNAAYRDLRWMTENELLNDRSIAAVIVETTLDDSPRAALACIEAGKHIHLDKPGAASHADFAALRTRAEQLNLTVQMGYMLRYNPAFELLFVAHREGWLGDITEISGSMGKLADPRLYQELASIPGHGMFELGCHLVDAVVYLLGKPSSVHAIGKPTGRAPASLADQRIPDNQLAVLEYPNAIATIRCNHGDPFGGPHRRFHVVGTKGAIDIHPLESGRGTISLSADLDLAAVTNSFAKIGPLRKGANRFELGVPPGRYDGEFTDLANVLLSRKPLKWSAEHDIVVHATALRCAGLPT